MNLLVILVYKTYSGDCEKAMGSFEICESFQNQSNREL